MAQLKEGSKAPAFHLADQSGKTHTLKDYAGRWLLIYFYPKDSTPGCTIEACAIRDNATDFKKSKIAILGVSTDSITSHEKFARKYQLPFPLLADIDKEMVEAYGVWGEKKFMGRTYNGTRRMSFLINPAGKIAKIYSEVKPKEHAGEVLADYKAL